MIYSGIGTENYYEICGMFINPKNPEELSNMPFNREQSLVSSVYEHLRSEKHGLHKEMELIQNKQSKLSRSQRDECILIFNNTYGK